MKATALLVIVACALAGCTDDSSSADNVGAVNARLDASSKAVALPASSPPTSPMVTSNRIAAAPKVFGRVGGAAATSEADFSGAPVDETSSQANSAGDALRNVNATTTSAP